ncbi:MAG: MerR family transcriptional regulator [Pseudoclavibacter sp.]|nr:MerR family transcriptional regulator [Pseudoclavibacter sp.]
MRISELSERGGVPAATIKFYTRSGLLPPGRRTGHNRTEYGQEHLARLRLVRALLTQGGLSLTAVREVLAVLDDPDVPTACAIGTAHSALPGPERAPSPESTRRIHELASRRNWAVREEDPAVAIAAAALDAYREIDRDDLADGLDDYAEAADLIATADLELTLASGARERMVESAVVGTIVGDRLLTGLRRIAQQSRSGEVLGPPDEEACSQSGQTREAPHDTRP